LYVQVETEKTAPSPNSDERKGVLIKAGDETIEDRVCRRIIFVALFEISFQCYMAQTFFLGALTRFQMQGHNYFVRRKARSNSN